jgi:hypothetical protein
MKHRCNKKQNPAPKNSSSHYALLFRIARRVDAIVILPFGNGRNARGSVFPVHTMTLLEVLLGHVYQA